MHFFFYYHNAQCCFSYLICSFTLWALLFVIARLLTLTLSVLTFGFGLPRTENQGFSLAEGNFNVLTIRQVPITADLKKTKTKKNCSVNKSVFSCLQVTSQVYSSFVSLSCRMSCLAAICLTQAWMMWKFINFQLKKWREHSQNQASKKKTVSPKSKPPRRESTRGVFLLYFISPYLGSHICVNTLIITSFVSFLL